jgi:putative aldouronate transport system substrate-binding protein
MVISQLRKKEFISNFLLPSKDFKMFLNIFPKYYRNMLEMKSVHRPFSLISHNNFTVKEKKFMKKLISLIMAMAMVLSLAACGSNAGDSSEPSVANDNTDQTEFTIIGGMSAMSPGYDDNEVLNQLQENVGISINWNTMSDSLSEQVNIHIAGGDLPDAFSGVGFSNYDLTNYGEDGTFIDLTPYINEEVMPNLTAILEENPSIRSAITMNDGKIYGLPAAEQMGTAGIGKDEDYSIYTIPQFSMINKKWLDELGLEVPTTLDELHDALVAFKENDMAAKVYGADAGSTIPMSTGFDEWCWGQNIFYAGFGFTNWTNDVCNDLVLQSDGTVNFVCDDDNYRDALTYFHEWYSEGLMDVEMFSQDDTQLMSKCQQGYVGVSTWWYIEELMGDYADDYVFLPVLTGPSGTEYEGESNVTVRTGGGTNAGQLSITSACESPVNLLKFFDQWYDGETVMQLQYGPIGVYFTEQDEDGVWQSITEEEAQEKFGKGAGELKSTYEVAGPKLILSEYYSKNFKMEDRAIERLTDLYDYWMPYVKDTTTYPVDCVYTADELDTIDRYKTDFQDTVAEQEGLWIKNGGPTDEEWEAYKQNLIDTCGMNELLEVYQNAYDRYAEAAE